MARFAPVSATAHVAVGYSLTHEIESGVEISRDWSRGAAPDAVIRQTVERSNWSMDEPEVVANDGCLTPALYAAIS